MRPVGLGGFPLALGELGAGGIQPAARVGQFGQQLLLGHFDFPRLGVQGIGIGVAGGDGLDVEVLGAFAGDTHRRTDTFGQRG